MSSKTSRTLLLASVFALGTAGFAGAQPAPGPGPGPQGVAPHHMHQMHHGQRGDGMMGFAAGEAFARADTNNDGKVTREEANAWLAARFAEIDANKDGGLTPDEIRAFYNARRGEGRSPPEGMRERMETHQAARFRFVDADLDGKITLPELRVMADAMFRSMDADGDGALTRTEVQRRGRRGDSPRAQQPAPTQPAPR
ncbi:MAG: EF-hand domain-containing protein [Roseomonas sp.]